MSKTIERAIENVKNSRFRWKNSEHTEFEALDSVIIWTNFRGEANRFGSKKVNFNLVLNQEFADELSKLGWNVKKIYGKDENGNEDPDQLLLFINVTVKMDSKYPPTVTLFTDWHGSKHRTTLDEESIGTLDNVTIATSDCTIGAYNSPMYKGKTTAYLRKLNVIQEKDDEYGGKYDEWLQSDTEDEHNYYPD